MEGVHSGVEIASETSEALWMKNQESGFRDRNSQTRDRTPRDNQAVFRAYQCDNGTRLDYLPVSQPLPTTALKASLVDDDPLQG